MNPILISEFLPQIAVALWHRRPNMVFNNIK